MVKQLQSCVTRTLTFCVDKLDLDRYGINKKNRCVLQVFGVFFPFNDWCNSAPKRGLYRLGTDFWLADTTLSPIKSQGDENKMKASTSPHKNSFEHLL